MRRFRILAIDLLLIALATVGAQLLRDNLEISQVRLAPLLPYLAYSLTVAAVVLPLLGTDKVLWRFSGIRDYSRLGAACAVVVLGSVGLGFATDRMTGIARSVPIIQYLLMLPLLVGLRVAMRIRRELRVKKRPALTLVAPSLDTSQEIVLVLGINKLAELFLQAVADFSADRIRVAGLLGRSERHSGREFRSHPVLGVPEDLQAVLHELVVHGVNVDRIVVAVPYDRLSPTAQQALLSVERGESIKVDFFTDRIGIAPPRATEPAGPEQRASTDGAALLTTSAYNVDAALSRPYWRIKRRVDTIAAAFLVIVLFPIMSAIGLLAAALLGSPAMFWQQRPGLNGAPFVLYKFRSMLGAHDDEGRRIPDDMRETTFGRFIRATRLDELPQLFSIMVGSMSFIGPRPLLAKDQLGEFQARLSVRPGLTGWAQVNGGKSVSALDKMALDLWYIRNASFLLDMKIIAKTLKMVVLGEQESPRAVEDAWQELRSHLSAPATKPSEVFQKGGIGKMSMATSIPQPLAMQDKKPVVVIYTDAAPQTGQRRRKA